MRVLAAFAASGALATSLLALLACDGLLGLDTLAPALPTSGDGTMPTDGETNMPEGGNEDSGASVDTGAAETEAGMDASSLDGPATESGPSDAGPPGNVVLLITFEGTIQDTSGYAHAISSSGVSVTRPLLGAQCGTGAGLFQSSYLEVLDPNEWLDLSADSTIEAWVYPTTGECLYPLFTQSQTINDGQWAMSLLSTSSTSTTEYLAFGDNDGVSPLTATNTIVSANAWHHVVTERRSGMLYLFVDGQPQTSESFAYPPLSSDALWIGRIYASSSCSTGYDYGRYYLDQVRITLGQARYAPGQSFTPGCN
jgi:hypothetical protein